jgi:protein-tyrosine phosphatase
MERREVLFLCTGNYYRSRFADILFNAEAVRRGLPWSSFSRGLAVERGVNNVGPIAREALRLLRERGVESTEYERFPLPARDEDFVRAARVIALYEEEHRPLVEGRHPLVASRVEYWGVVDVPGILPQVERQVLALLDECEHFLHTGR